MNVCVRLFVMLLVLALPLEPSPGQDQTPDASCRNLLEKALLDQAHVKVGVTRREIEKYFLPDGGAQFPSSTRYVYPKCPLVHMDVEFQAKGDVKHPFSPEDIVIKASKLYLDYPLKD